MNKTIFLSSLFVLFFNSIFAQENEEQVVKHHEIKTNAFNLIVFKSVDFSYEYLIDSESSAGVSVLFNLQDFDNDSNDGPIYNEKFAFTPYYRRFFSSKYAQGFFLEAFGMYNVQEEPDGYYDYSINEYVSSDENSNNVAFGISLGGKFVSKKGFLFEFFGGAGRNIFSSNENISADIVPRVGVVLGYRF
ncbi:MAG: DUF3575 domain-containing protein [Flavobacteriaceae bacterium]|nr:DUF3575 domain-containing protein [Flavobacteriaceae bacterium]